MSGRIEPITSAASTWPSSASQPATVTSWHSNAQAHRPVLDPRNVDVATPLGRAETAYAIASVAPLVNATFAGGQAPTRAATWSRAVSIATLLA